MRDEGLPLSFRFALEFVSPQAQGRESAKPSFRPSTLDSRSSRLPRSPATSELYHFAIGARRASTTNMPVHRARLHRALDRRLLGPVRRIHKLCVSSRMSACICLYLPVSACRRAHTLSPLLVLTTSL